MRPLPPIPPPPELGEGLGVGARLPTGCRDLRQYHFDVLFHLLIAEPDHAIAIRFKLLCARLVTLRLCFVDAAVNFDDQPMRCTIEVGNEWPSGDVVAETSDH